MLSAGSQANKNLIKAPLWLTTTVKYENFPSQKRGAPSSLSWLWPRFFSSSAATLDTDLVPSGHKSRCSDEHLERSNPFLNLFKSPPDIYVVI